MENLHTSIIDIEQDNDKELEDEECLANQIYTEGFYSEEPPSSMIKNRNECKFIEF